MDTDKDPGANDEIFRSKATQMEREMVGGAKESDTVHTNGRDLTEETSCSCWRLTVSVILRIQVPEGSSPHV